MSTRRALVALDLTEQTDGLLTAAVSWGARLGLTLDLRHVHPLPVPLEPLAGTGQFPSLVEEWQAMNAVAAARLSELASRVPEPMRGDWHVLVGSPADVIAEKAQGYDLLVVGTHGYRGLAHLFLGSVAEWLVRRSPCPVLVLHRDDPPTAPAGDLVVVVPIDPGAPSLAAPTFLARVPGGAGLRIHLVAIEDRDVDDPGEALQSLRYAAESAGLPASTPLHVRERGGRHVGDAVVAACAELGAGLCVMPTHQRTGMEHLLVGSVAERVARTARCPILTVGGA